MLYLGDQINLFNKIEDNSIDAIITDPPYNLNWNHKIETNLNWDNFLLNAFRVLKHKGFLVYFGQEPTMSVWNFKTLNYFKYLAEIIWYKCGNSNLFIYPLRTHEKIIIFTKCDMNNKSGGVLNKATIDYVDEKQELIEFATKQNLLRVISSIKSFINKCDNLNELKYKINERLSEVNRSNSKNDPIYIHKYAPKRTNHVYYYLNPKKLTTLWACKAHNQQGYNKKEFNIPHPTVKPIQILERLIEMTTNTGYTVLDPFMGSGTTGIACKRLNRNFIGFEIHEDYYNLAKDRINNYLDLKDLI